jgi:hypothetical protein
MGSERSMIGETSGKIRAGGVFTSLFIQQVGSSLPLVQVLGDGVGLPNSKAKAFGESSLVSVAKGWLVPLGSSLEIVEGSVVLFGHRVTHGEVFNLSDCSLGRHGIAKMSPECSRKISPGGKRTREAILDCDQLGLRPGGCTVAFDQSQCRRDFLAVTSDANVGKIFVAGADERIGLLL